MGFTKDQLVALFQELQIGFSQHEHPVALTVEEQAKHVGHLKGGISKNLFLKDKKQRLYIVSALAETKVDLKVLSVRLGLGKGGLRMAPEEALAVILQVPLGCVTPFALVNDSARHVILLLDQGFKNHEFCFFHPLSNDVSVAVNAAELDKFLISIGKTPAYVDLEANPKVGKDQPPDLAVFVPSDAKVLADPAAKTGATQGPENEPVAKPEATQGPKNDQVPVNNKKSTVETGSKGAKPSNASKKAKEKTSDAVDPPFTNANTDEFVEDILGNIKSIVLSKGELATTVPNYMNKLGEELKIITNIFKNKAYTEGFSTGIHHQPKRN